MRLNARLCMRDGPLFAVCGRTDGRRVRNRRKRIGNFGPGLCCMIFRDPVTI